MTAPSASKQQPADSGRASRGWRAFIDGLATPSSLLPESVRSQARLLSYFLLLLIVLLACLLPVLLLLVPEFRGSGQPIVFVLLILFLGGIYTLSRTRYHLTASVLTVVATAGVVWAFAFTDRSGAHLVAQNLTFLVVSLFISGLLLPLPYTVGLSLVHLLMLLFLPHFIPSMEGAPSWENLLVYIGVVSALAILVASLRQRTQSEIDRRSQALAESEAQLQSILDNSTALIYLKDAQGRYLLVNKSYEAAFNVRRDELIGRTTAAVFPEGQAREYWATDEQVLTTGKSLELEETATSLLGERTYLTVKFPLRSSDGKIQAVGSFSTDITDRKLASEALLQSEERFRLVSYATSDAVWDWDFSTDQVWWSQNLRRLFGYQAAEVHPERGWWEEQIHPEEREKVLTSLHEAIVSGKEFWSKEFRFRRADGSYAHVLDRGYVMHNEQSQPVRVLGALMDITQWRQAEEEMEADRSLLRTMIDLIPDNIYVKDVDGRILLNNLADAREIGAASPQASVGKTIFDYFAPDEASHITADDKLVLEAGQKVINREEQRADRKGGQKWLTTTKVPLLDAAGKVIGLVGIGHDITNRKQIEKALKEANEKQTAWIGELEQRTKETGLLNEMSDFLQTCSNYEEAYRVIGELARQLFPHEAGGLYIINSSRNLADLVTSWGPPLDELPAFQPNDCWGLRMGRMHVMDRVTPDSHRAGESLNMRCNHLRPPGPEAYVCVPLIASGEAIGLLHIRTPGTPAAGTWFTEAKQQLIRSVAYRGALSLANLKLRETLRQQSIRDPLTGLFNRRYMEESLERELHRVTRNQHPLGVIMIDIDHFKDFNDNFGHDAGDTVLRELSGLLRSKIRAEDIACRYGGEEFVLILPEASLEITRRRAEALREAVKRLELKYKGQPLNSISISAGVAAFPNQGQAGGEILRAADVALYGAKHAGRDQVVVADVQAAQLMPAEKKPLSKPKPPQTGG